MKLIIRIKKLQDPRHILNLHFAIAIGLTLSILIPILYISLIAAPSNPFPTGKASFVN